MEAKAFTHIGLQRKTNEDAWYIDPRGAFFAIADGMGGHKGGDIASRFVLTYLEEEDLTQKELRQVFQEINERIYKFGQENEDYRGLGTTLTMVSLDADKISLAHIGDSRAYLLRQGKIMQMTTDHTMVNELLRSEEITQAQALDHPYKNVLSRALGVEKEIDIEEKTYLLEEGDLVLLSSDGLHGYLSDKEIVMTFAKNKYDIDKTAASLLKQVLKKGAKDNITFLILKDIFARGEEGVNDCQNN